MFSETIFYIVEPLQKEGRSEIVCFIYVFVTSKL